MQGSSKDLGKTPFVQRPTEESEQPCENLGEILGEKVFQEAASLRAESQQGDKQGCISEWQCGGGGWGERGQDRGNSAREDCKLTERESPRGHRPGGRFKNPRGSVWGWLGRGRNQEKAVGAGAEKAHRASGQAEVWQVVLPKHHGHPSGTWVGRGCSGRKAWETQCEGALNELPGCRRSRNVTGGTPQISRRPRIEGNAPHLLARLARSHASTRWGNCTHPSWVCPSATGC